MKDKPLLETKEQLFGAGGSGYFWRSDVEQALRNINREIEQDRLVDYLYSIEEVKGLIERYFGKLKDEKGD